MLEEILAHIHNYFVVDMIEGDFEISSGSLTLDFLKEGQYFRILGSVFNDGVYQYPASDLTDEKFSGTVWAMAVPPAVIALALEIETWTEKYGDALNSPYQSESFGGYSYSKSSGGASAVDASVGWRDVFRSRLNRWRKIRE